ncbi:MAG: helix-turn-helix domain-containing protein [Clostridia bacterium]|nr:helix-turn-helix domain-containing protein [Clostridia bacterium]
MEKYTTFNIIRQHDIQEYGGLETEIITHFHNPQGRTFPLSLSCFGVTFPTPDYYIKRYPVRGFILEHIVSGKGYVVIDGKKHTVSEGDTYLLKSGENCEYYSDKKNPYKKLWVNFSGEFPRSLISLYQLKDNFYKNVKLDDLFEKLYAIENISTDIALVRFDATAVITEMLMRLAKSIDKLDYMPETAIKIKTALIRSVNKPFSLENLCNELFLSKSEIIRIFKKSFKETPYRFLLNIKISYAKTMLENSMSSIKEIADHLGFSSPYHFSDTFKKHVGISPVHYRKNSFD